jgi:outer membrane protein OmpA-like peptidoglycan-associated protein
MLPVKLVTTDYKGKSNPVAANDAPGKGMALNRRVEIGLFD